MAKNTVRRWVQIIFDRLSAKKTEAEMAASLGAAGKKGGENFLRELRTAFDKRMADLKNQLAKGLIDPKQFRAQADIAAKQFNVGILAGIEKTRVAGKLTESEYLKLSRTLKKTGDEGASAGDRIKASFKGAVAALAAAFSLREIGRFFSGSIKEFADFDLAMTQSLSIMGDVDEVMRERMVKAAHAMSKELNLAASDVARGFYFLASAGLSAEQSLAALPVVARFAKAGAFDLARATSLLTDAQSALGLAIKNDTVKHMENLVRVSDVLTKAGILSNASVEQFSAAMTNQAGPALRQTNKDIEEGAAVLAVFADQGLKGESAGEQLSIVLRELQRASRENRKEFDRLGIHVFTSSGALRNMADITGELERALGPMSVEMRGATLATLGFTERSISGLKALLGTSDAIRNYEVQLRQAAGTTQSVADKQMKAFAERWGQVKQELAAARSELGLAIIKALDLEHNLPRLIALIAAFGRHAADLVGIMGSLLKAVVLLAGFKGLMALRAAFIAAESGIALFRVGIQRLFVAIGPTGWVIIGLTALIELFRRSGQAAEEAAEKAKAALADFRTALKDTKDLELDAAESFLAAQEKQLRARLAALKAARPAGGREGLAGERDAAAFFVQNTRAIEKVEAELNATLAKGNAIRDERKQRLKAAPPPSGGGDTGGDTGGGTTDPKAAKARGAELERIERDIAVARLQIAEGLTEALARDAVHRNELLHPQAERTAATAAELEAAWKKLDALRTAVEVLGESGAPDRLSQNIEDVGVKAGSAIPAIQEMTRELFIQQSLLRDGVDPLTSYGEHLAELAGQQFDAAARFATPWTQALGLIRNEVEGEGTLFRELGEAWAEGGIAGLARLAAGKVKENVARAIEEAAKALGSLFFNPAEAAAHATSAVKHGAAAVAWRAIAGSGGGSQGASSTGGVSSGAPNQPRAGAVEKQSPEVHIHFKGSSFFLPEVQKQIYASQLEAREKYGPNTKVIVHRGP